MSSCSPSIEGDIGARTPFFLFPDCRLIAQRTWYGRSIFVLQKRCTWQPASSTLGPNKKDDDSLQGSDPLSSSAFEVDVGSSSDACCCRSLVGAVVFQGTWRFVPTVMMSTPQLAREFEQRLLLRRGESALCDAFFQSHLASKWELEYHPRRMDDSTVAGDRPDAGDLRRAAGSTVAIRVSPYLRLAGGGCRQSTEKRNEAPPSLSGASMPSARVPTPTSGGGVVVQVRPQTPAQSGNALVSAASPPRQLNAHRPTPLLIQSAIPAGTNITSVRGGNNSAAACVPPHSVGYTRHRTGNDDDDEEIITVHGVDVDDRLSEVDVHSVDMNDPAAVSNRLENHLDFALPRQLHHRKSASEISGVSSRQMSCSLGGVVSNAVSEHNIAATPHGHSDSVLRRIVLDRSSELGRGGYGVVFSAHDRVTGEKYAVKEAHYGKQGGDALMENLRSEFKTLSRLSHINVIRVYNFLLDEDELVARIVLELADNGSVRKLLKASALTPTSASATPSSSTTLANPAAQQLGGSMRCGLSEASVRRIIYQALLGLHYLHVNGIIHRDIKPDNLLIGEDNIVKLSDFGTCKNSIHASTGTTTTVVGTVCYMSPESISGSFSTGSDIWSVGATVVELLSGVPPWSEARCQQNIQLVFHIGSAKPPHHKPQYPHAVLSSSGSAGGSAVYSPLSAAAAQFLDACFVFDSKQRPSAVDLLQLAWFNGVVSELPKQVRQHLNSNALPASRYKPLPHVVTTPNGTRVPGRSLFPLPSTVSGPRGGDDRLVRHRQSPRPANRDEPYAYVYDDEEDEEDEDSFESWRSDEEEDNRSRPNHHHSGRAAVLLNVDEDDEEEYEYV